MDMKDVVIIGAGPSGIATAIQLRRYHIEPTVLEKEEIGGLLRNAFLVENYPGFPDGIKGLELAGLFREQLENAAVKVRQEKVQRLEYEQGAFLLETSRGTITSAIVVIATGTQPRMISSLAMSAEVRDRVFYDVLPILGIANKKIAIIGAGDAAFDYALSLSAKNEIIIINRSERPGCIPVLGERCLKSANISCLQNVNVRRIDWKSDKLLLTCVRGDERNFERISADYLVVAVGRDPCLDFVGGELEREMKALVEANKLHMVGDVHNGMCRQTAICVGDGLRTAMSIHRHIGSGDA